MNDVNLTLGDSQSQKPSFVLDAGFAKHPWHTELCKLFEIRFIGGAVMNAIEILHHPHSIYLKTPKYRMGGCAIWDLAAISLLIQNAGGTVHTFDGSPLLLNREHSLYFNDVGFVFTGAAISFEDVQDMLHDFQIDETVLAQ